MKKKAIDILEYHIPEWEGMTEEQQDDLLTEFHSYAEQAIKADRAALRKQMVDRIDLKTIDNHPLPELK
ncbi:hypothetical protein [Dyadobacter sandarakinus]|uniref:Addiction module component n=1 Tax=Dyadobacter sandarakinus TaxID=2747268 RepID=A0ABX7I1U3_9BACT|nr:hypothetical protein [Dyadobacter sandarakinus]QRQ99739.1 hypothetical protein HWI92_01805 [Dyadobacter sandarakinus]